MQDIPLGYSRSKCRHRPNTETKRRSRQRDPGFKVVPQEQVQIQGSRQRNNKKRAKTTAWITEISRPTAGAKQGDSQGQEAADDKLTTCTKVRQTKLSNVAALGPATYAVTGGNRLHPTGPERSARPRLPSSAVCAPLRTRPL